MVAVPSTGADIVADIASVRPTGLALVFVSAYFERACLASANGEEVLRNVASVVRPWIERGV